VWKREKGRTTRPSSLLTHKFSVKVQRGKLPTKLFAKY
jgi:hypothetical protein